MNIKNIDSLQGLLLKEVNRKQFLLYLGLLIITISGLSSIAKKFQSFPSSKVEKGFGSNPYGL